MAYLIVDKCWDVIDILPANEMKWVNIHAGAANSDKEPAPGVDNSTNSKGGK